MDSQSESDINVYGMNSTERALSPDYKRTDGLVLQVAPLLFCGRPGPTALPAPLPAKVETHVGASVVGVGAVVLVVVVELSSNCSFGDDGTYLHTYTHTHAHTP